MLLGACWFSVAVAESDFSSTEKKIKLAMEDERRSEADSDRDRNRRPVQTLEFFRLRDDMSVLELLPGGGWYTNILAPVLEENGKLYIAIGAERVFEAVKEKPGFRSIELIPFDRANFVRTPGSRQSSISEFSFGIRDIDLAVTFRNLHNFNHEGRTSMNRAVLEALKPGGLYGVIDHTRRHMQKDHDEARRRLDPVRVIKEIESAGFEFVDYSSLHYRPDDELRYEVGRKTVTGNTDRFTLLFRKP